MGLTYDMRQFTRNAETLANSAKDKAKRTMLDVSRYVEGEAKDRAPFDTGQLTLDITGNVQTSGEEAAAVIRVPANAQSASYAVKMHEFGYSLGKGSLRKQERTGKAAGAKFITRAIDDNLDRIRRMIKELFNK